MQNVNDRNVGMTEHDVNTAKRTSEQSSTRRSGWLYEADLSMIDAHVHLHSCFGVDSFFDHAAHNFHRAAAMLGHAREPLGFLLLTERSGEDMFQVLADDAGRQKVTKWHVRTTEEPEVLIVQHPAETIPIVVVSGWQIATREGLELLLLGTRERWPDGMPLQKLLEATRSTSALRVLPWGFGKWIGKRGRIIRSILETASPEDLAVGDNAGRLRGTPEPGLIRFARSRGLAVLPGSDPLPFAGDVTKAGRFGSYSRSARLWSRPSTQLRRMLRSKSDLLSPYGTLENPVNFTVNQVRMQWHKRFAPHMDSPFEGGNIHQAAMASDVVE